MTVRRYRDISAATERSHLVELMASPTQALLVTHIDVEPDTLEYELIRLVEPGDAEVLPSRKGVESVPVQVPFMIPAGSSNGVTVKVVGPMRRGDTANVAVYFEEI